MSGLTREQWYKRLLRECQEEFENLQAYLLKENRADDYIAFVSIEHNFFRFKIGNRSVLLSYHINKKELKKIFKTQEIIINENDYGKFKLKDLTDLNFESVPSETYYVNNKGDKVHLPNPYLKKVEDNFDTI